MELGNILLGSAAIISSVTALVVAARKNKQDQMADVRNDIAVLKEVTYYSLQGIVELGANGDVKKAQQRFEKSLFDNTH